MIVEISRCKGGSRWLCHFPHFVFNLPLQRFFFFKQKTAYEMRISDWSSDVCSSDLAGGDGNHEISAGKPYERPFGNSRLWPEINLSQLVQLVGEIGRASCRERVCQYV